MSRAGVGATWPSSTANTFPVFSATYSAGSPGRTAIAIGVSIDVTFWSRRWIEESGSACGCPEGGGAAEDDGDSGGLPAGGLDGGAAAEPPPVQAGTSSTAAVTSRST